MNALKWIGIALIGLIAIFIISYVVIYFVSESRLNYSYDLQVESLKIPTDSVAIAGVNTLPRPVVALIAMEMI